MRMSQNHQKIAFIYGRVHFYHQQEDQQQDDKADCQETKVQYQDVELDHQDHTDLKYHVEDLGTATTPVLPITVRFYSNFCATVSESTTINMQVKYVSCKT